jgi:2-keto-3-deoxy-L-rhamnonate aldolase RhmA
MNEQGLRARMLRRDPLCGTFVKTPAVEIVEVLARSGLDFLCFDGEHAPFDRYRQDSCIAVARALGMPVLIRVPVGAPAEILKALDAGATGVVVPHCKDVATAKAIAKAAHFGHGGRGYAGSTRWAGYATRSMTDVLAEDAETIVIGQIEEPEGVDAVEQIAAVDGIDGVFVGPADLAVCYGVDRIDAEPVRAAIQRVSDAAKAAGIASVTFAPSAEMTADLKALGVTMIFFASEHAWILQGARATSAEFKTAMA